MQNFTQHEETKLAELIDSGKKYSEAKAIIDNMRQTAKKLQESAELVKGDYAAKLSELTQASKQSELDLAAQNAIKAAQENMQVCQIAAVNFTAQKHGVEVDSVRGLVCEQTKTPKGHGERLHTPRKDTHELHTLTSAYDASKMRKDTAAKWAQLPAQFTCDQYKKVFGYNLNSSKLPYVAKVEIAA